MKTGEVIGLSNNKEYICLDSIKREETEYVYLLGNFKPAEVKFGIVRGTPEDMMIEIVNNPDQKKMILKLFQDKLK